MRLMKFLQETEGFYFEMYHHMNSNGHIPSFYNHTSFNKKEVSIFSTFLLAFCKY